MFEAVPGSPKARIVGAAIAVSFALAAWFLLAVVSPSLALKVGGASNFSLGGNATVVHPGNGSPTAAELSSTANSESHVNIAVPRKLKLRDLDSLSTDFKFVAGSCWAGSPRFTANVTNGTSQKSIFFYIRCTSNGYANTGNLAAPSSLVDAHQLGGSLSDPYSSVQANFGGYTVKAVHIDVDGGSAGNQTVDFDNTVVNSKLVTYEPQHGISFLLERTGGKVKLKAPGKRKYKSSKKVEQVRFDSVIDTRGGRVEVTAATGNFGETTPDNAMAFYDGVMRLKQGRRHDAPATAKLVGKLQCPKGGASRAKASKSSGPVATTSRKRRRRRLWGSGSGNYQTSGGGGTGSVRGTTWLTRDTCRGTYFKVTQGLGITVNDFGLHKRINLGPGQNYFARIR